MAAVRSGVTADLQGSQASISPSLVVNRSIQRLQDTAGLGDEPARWAVESWAVALGVLDGSAVSSPQPAYPSQQWSQPISTTTAGQSDMPAANVAAPSGYQASKGKLAVAGTALLVGAIVLVNLAQRPSLPAYNPDPYQNPTVSSSYPTDTVSAPSDAAESIPASPAVSEASTQVTPALLVTTGIAYAGDSPGGAIEADLSWPGGPITNHQVTAYVPKTDVQGQVVRGDAVDSEWTGNDGKAELKVPAGQYLVSTDLPGSKWGDQPATNGTVVTVTSGQTTRLAIACGAIVFEATTVDGVVTNKQATVLTQKTNVQGQPVKGDQIDSEWTDNTGSVTFMLTPGSYELASDFTGYNWGDLSDEDGQTSVAVSAGQKTTVLVALGRLRVAAGSPNQQVCVHKSDSSQVDCGWTDNTGFWLENITAGSYTVHIGSQSHVCEVSAGKETACP